MNMKNKETNSSRMSAILWIVTGLLLIGLLFARAVYPEHLWMTVVVCVPLVASLAGLVHFNRKALRSRSAAYGVNSAITALLVISIIGVLNFLSSRYPHRIDLTKNKIHTLSAQTVKIVKSLNQPVKATFFAKLPQREKFQPLLDNYSDLNTKFKVEYVDPDREPTLAKADGINRYGTLHIQVGARTSNIVNPTEESLTNGLIKLTRDKIPVLCAISGHGEKSLDSNQADGYAAMKKELLEQSYDTKTISLLQTGKIPSSCDAIAILGATKAFFPQEIKLIGDYLANGGRAIVAVDLNIKGSEYAPQLLDLLKTWHVETKPAMVIDPISRQLGVDASVPILVTYSKENPITKDFHSNCYFPFLRPLDVIPNAPVGMTVQWLAKTTPNALTVTNMKELASGQVRIDPKTAQRGPFTTAIAVDGKLQGSKAKRKTRLVVFGTSNFATNNFSRFGGNSDFFLNSVAWVMKDNNMISIRPKTEAPSVVNLSQKEGIVIGLFTVLVIPALIAAAGILVWAVRRRL